MTDLPKLPDSAPSHNLPAASQLTFADLKISSQIPTPSPDQPQPDDASLSQNVTLPVVAAQLSVPEGELSTPFHIVFAGRECRSAAELAQALADAWDEARRGLLSGSLAESLDAVNLSAAAVCREHTAAVAAGQMTPDRAVLEVIHRLSGERIVVWQGRRYAHGIDLGSSLLQALRGTGTIPAHCDSLLMSAAASLFAEEGQQPGLAALEARYAAPDCTTREKTCLMYMVGFLLCGTAALVIEGETFYTVEQLAAWLEGRARRSSAAFTRACHRLLDADHLLDPQLEAWLIALGRRQDVAQWQAEIDAGIL